MNSLHRSKSLGENYKIISDGIISNNENEIFSEKKINERKRPKNIKIRKTLTSQKEIEKKSEIVIPNKNRNNEEQENKREKEKNLIPNFIRQRTRFNTLSDKRKNKKKVSFIEKYMITVIEVESFKRYNYINTSRNGPSTDSISCKCNIF